MNVKYTPGTGKRVAGNIDQQATMTDKRTISVDGEAALRVNADTFVVVLRSVAEDKDLVTARTMATDGISRANTAAFRAEGVDAVNSSSFTRINYNTPVPGEAMKIVGYTVTMALEIETKNPRDARKFIESVRVLKGVQVASVDAVLRERTDAERRAKVMATSNAMKLATEMAEELEEKIVRVLRVSSGESQSAHSSYERAYASKDAGGRSGSSSGEFPVVVAPILVTGRVRLIVELD